jgi:hypothetical protein
MSATPAAGVALALVVAGLAGAAPPREPHTPDVARRFAEDVAVLASDEMEGRGLGTAGLGRAADWIEKRLRGIGLRQAFGGSYRQPFDVKTGVAPGDEALQRADGDGRVDAAASARVFTGRRGHAPAHGGEGVGRAGDQIRLLVPAVGDVLHVAAGVGGDGAARLALDLLAPFFEPRQTNGDPHRSAAFLLALRPWLQARCRAKLPNTLGPAREAAHGSRPRRAPRARRRNYFGREE